MHPGWLGSGFQSLLLVLHHPFLLSTAWQVRAVSRYRCERKFCIVLEKKCIATHPTHSETCQKKPHFVKFPSAFSQHFFSQKSPHKIRNCSDSDLDGGGQKGSPPLIGKKLFLNLNLFSSLPPKKKFVHGSCPRVRVRSCNEEGCSHWSHQVRLLKGSGVCSTYCT